MAKITRKSAKVFGSTAGLNQISQFGSLAAGAPAYSTDPTTIQALSNYLAGWFSGIVGSNSPAIEDMNALCYLYAYQIAYDLQEGVAEWDSATPYFIGCIVNDGVGNLYISITDNNTNNAVSDTTNWRRFLFTSPLSAQNYSLAAAVAANALTISLKNAAGNNGSAGDYPVFSFRNATSATGTYSVLNVPNSLALTIPSGTTLGSTSGNTIFAYIYALNNSGTIELAISLNKYDDATIVSTIAISGGSSSDAIYSTTARSNVPIKLIGRIKFNETTAGTWATAPSEISLGTSFITSGVIGNMSGNAISPGYIGEFLDAYNSGTIATSASVLATVTLTAGVWRLSGSTQMNFNIGGNGVTGNWRVSGTDLTTVGRYTVSNAWTGNDNISTTWPDIYVRLASGTANKDVSLIGTAVHTVTSNAYILATRIG